MVEIQTPWASMTDAYVPNPTAAKSLADQFRAVDRSRPMQSTCSATCWPSDAAVISCFYNAVLLPAER